MTFLRLAVLLAAALTLAGCVLDSKTPLFKDSDGELALGKGPITYAGWTLEKDGWKQDGGGKTLTITAMGQSYDVAVPEGEGKEPSHGTATFVKLDGSHYVVQVVDPESKSANYAVASIDKDEIYLGLLACTDLEKAAVTGGHIDFEKYSCHARDVSDPTAFFGSIQALAKQEMKLVPVR